MKPYKPHRKPRGAFLARPLQNHYSRPKTQTATGSPMAVNFFIIFGAERGT